MVGEPTQGHLVRPEIGGLCEIVALLGEVGVLLVSPEHRISANLGFARVKELDRKFTGLGLRIHDHHRQRILRDIRLGPCVAYPIAVNLAFIFRASPFVVGFCDHRRVRAVSAWQKLIIRAVHAALLITAAQIRNVRQGFGGPIVRTMPALGCHAVHRAREFLVLRHLFQHGAHLGLGHLSGLGIAQHLFALVRACHLGEHRAHLVLTHVADLFLPGFGVHHLGGGRGLSASRRLGDPLAVAVLFVLVLDRRPGNGLACAFRVLFAGVLFRRAVVGRAENVLPVLGEFSDGFG